MVVTITIQYAPKVREVVQPSLSLSNKLNITFMTEEEVMRYLIDVNSK